jgi:hypothetical protein
MHVPTAVPPTQSIDRSIARIDVPCSSTQKMYLNKNIINIAVDISTNSIVSLSLLATCCFLMEY